MFETMTQTFGTGWAYLVSFVILFAWWGIYKIWRS